MSYFIPLFVVITLLIAIIKKEKVFTLFCEGASKGLKNSANIFPSVLGLMVGVGMLKASGFFDIFSDILTPICNIFDIPAEIIPMAILRPMSGSGAFSILQGIFKEKGVNSFAGLCASVMSGATETTFYTLAIYYGAIGVTKTRHNLFVSLTSDLISFILSVLTVRYFFF